MPHIGTLRVQPAGWGKCHQPHVWAILVLWLASLPHGKHPCSQDPHAASYTTTFSAFFSALSLCHCAGSPPSFGPPLPCPRPPQTLHIVIMAFHVNGRGLCPSNAGLIHVTRYTVQLGSWSVSSSQLDPKFKTENPSPTAPPRFPSTLPLKPIETTDPGVPFSFHFFSCTPGIITPAHRPS